MIITYTQDLSDYQDQEELGKIKEAITSFNQLVQQNKDASLLNIMQLTVGVDNTLKDNKNNPVPAISSLQNMSIDFNIEWCKERFTDHYLSLFAHEIGHIFPQKYPGKKLFQKYLRDPSIPYFEDAEKKCKDPFPIPKFESNLPPYREFVADYHACGWVGKEKIKTLRRVNSSQGYLDVIDKYPNEDEYRVAAHEFIKKLQYRGNMSNDQILMIQES